MKGIEIGLLAIGLAMDCFAVSIASGITLKRFRWRNLSAIAFVFGFFQALMPLLGWMGAITFSHLIKSVDHWVSFSILSYLGVRMIHKCASDKEQDVMLDFGNRLFILTIAIATSIDALAAGISFAFLGVCDYTDIIVQVLIIGFVSYAMSLAGFLFGFKYGRGYASKLKAEMWGGIILVAIGVKILVEHLYFQQELSDLLQFQ